MSDNHQDAIESLPEGLQDSAKAITELYGDQEMLGDLFAVTKVLNLPQHDPRSIFASSRFSNGQSSPDGFVPELEDRKLGASARRRKTSYGGLLSGSAVNSTQRKNGVSNPDPITYDTYDRMRRDLALPLALIKAPIINAGYTIESTSAKVSALVEWNLEKIMFNMVNDLMMGINHGLSNLEKTFKKVKNLRLIKNTSMEDEPEVVYEGEALLLWPYAIHPSTYNILLDKHGEMLGILQRKAGDFSGERTSIKKSKLITFVNEKEYGNWFGQSRLKNAYPWWYWSKIIEQFLLKYLERKASPPLIVKARPGRMTDSDGVAMSTFELALKIAKGLNSNSIGIMPQEYSKDGKPLWDIQYLTDDNRIVSFIEILNFAQVMFYRALMVPDNVAVQSSSTGSYAASDISSSIYFILEEALIQNVEQVINNQVVPYMVKYNFPEEERVAVRVKLERLSASKKQTLREIANKMFGVINTYARDGAIPKAIPDLTAMMGELDIPMTRTDNLFDFTHYSPMNDADKEDDGSDDDKNPSEEEDKVKENNKDKVRKPRTRQQKRKEVV